MRKERILKRRVNNLIQSVLLIIGMVLLLAVLGWLIAGALGLVSVAFIGALFLLFSPRASPRLILRMYHARRLTAYEAPLLLRIVDELSNRAELSCTPLLYYIPSQLVNAFAVGRCDNAAIGLTDGLLRHLNRAELAGVLAHEISHIRDNDLQVMGLADVISRLTSMLSWVGQFLLIINLPLILMSDYNIPWIFIGLLIIAPTLSALMQLALSRTREYDADLDAARLTGNPRGLASALVKLENLQGGWMERIFLPGRRVPEPSLFRTHPGTDERVRRLLELEEDLQPTRIPVVEERPRAYIDRNRLPITQLRLPRWRVTGLWY